MSRRPDRTHVRRLSAQLLAGSSARDPLAVAERLLAIQGQDPRGARLAIRARSRGVRAADIDHALTEERSLLITWLNRGTLHLVRSEDYAWLHPLLTAPLDTSNLTRLRQCGIDSDQAARGVAVMERALSETGPLTRLALRDRLRAAGLPTEGQALIHLLFRATLQGVAVRGPIVGNEHAYALVRDWLGPQPSSERDRNRDRDRALAELARRYLAGHGPADERDLARWAGLPLRDARAGVSAIASELETHPGGLVDLAGRRPAPMPAPRLLGAFEPLLLGWRSREPVLAEHAGKVVSGGIFRAFVLADGRAVGLWRLRGGAVELEPFAALEPGVVDALHRDAIAVREFLGLA